MPMVVCLCAEGNNECMFKVIEYSSLCSRLLGQMQNEMTVNTKDLESCLLP